MAARKTRKASSARKAPGKSATKTSSWGAKTPRKRRSKFGRKSAAGGTSIKHACGHTQRHAIKGKGVMKDREITRQESLKCTTCWSEDKAEEAEMLADVPNLPPLDGTDPMIRWARSIRGMAIFRIKSEMAGIDRQLAIYGMQPVVAPLVQKAVDKALKLSKARWWIDHKDIEKPLQHFLTEIQFNKIQKAAEELHEAIERGRPGSDVPF